MQKVINDPVFGTVRLFSDSWCGKKAVCYLFGTGPGPDGELVRVVGNPRKNGGFDLDYVRSYERDCGWAGKAYEFLVRTYGQKIDVYDVTSPEGYALNLAMKDRGFVGNIFLGIADLQPAKRETPAPAF